MVIQKRGKKKSYIGIEKVINNPRKKFHVSGEKLNWPAELVSSRPGARAKPI